MWKLDMLFAIVCLYPTLFQKDLIVWKLYTDNTTVRYYEEFQKDLIVWKLKILEQIKAGVNGFRRT